MWPALPVILLLCLYLRTYGYFYNIDFIVDFYDALAFTFADLFEDIDSFIRYAYAIRLHIVECIVLVGLFMFAICAYFDLDMDNFWRRLHDGGILQSPEYFKKYDSPTTQGSVVTATPITPPRSPPPLLPLPTRTPPPELPFENFRFNGTPFAGHNPGRPYGGFIPFTSAYRYKSTQDKNAAIATASWEPEETQSTIEAKPEPVTKTVATIPTQQAPEPDADTSMQSSFGSEVTPSAAPAPSVGLLAHTGTTPTSSPLRAIEDVTAHPEKLVPAPAQRTEDEQPPVPLISPEVMINIVFASLNGSSGDLGSAMLAVLPAFLQGLDYEVSVHKVSSLMRDARTRLDPFFPQGLPTDQATRLN
jgi:hypothetical protein